MWGLIQQLSQERWQSRILPKWWQIRLDMCLFLGYTCFFSFGGDIVHHSAYTNLTSLPTRGVRYPVNIHIYIYIYICIYTYILVVMIITDIPVKWGQLSLVAMISSKSPSYSHNESKEQKGHKMIQNCKVPKGILYRSLSTGTCDLPMDYGPAQEVSGHIQGLGLCCSAGTWLSRLLCRRAFIPFKFAKSSLTLE